jgi:hypothetical protein
MGKGEGESMLKFRTKYLLLSLYPTYFMISVMHDYKGAFKKRYK